MRRQGGLFLSLFMLTATMVLSPNILAHHNEPIQPLPASIPKLNPEKVALGKKLFHDKRLSANNTLACASCHPVQAGGMLRGQRFSVEGLNGETVRLNIPTVFNAAYNHVLHKDGSVSSLHDQIDRPITNPSEMGASWPMIVQKLGQISEYQDLFDDIYDGVSEFAVKDAIVNYEKTLITLNAPIDRFLRGDFNALSALQKIGYVHFKQIGCANCHQGRNVGGNLLQPLGIGNIEAETLQSLDPLEILENRTTANLLRVPSLRNVATTAPYLHDGRIEKLEDAIRLMAREQLGEALNDEKVLAIKAFLEALTGEVPHEARP